VRDRHQSLLSPAEVTAKLRNSREDGVPTACDLDLGPSLDNYPEIVNTVVTPKIKFSAVSVLK
jgi:hypothetical protein